MVALAATPPATIERGWSDPEVPRRTWRRPAGAVLDHLRRCRLEAGAKVGDVFGRQRGGRLGLEPQRVFRPEKEKSQPGTPFSGRGREKRFGSPVEAARSTFGPPG
jgi:hypothetical protein